MNKNGSKSQNKEKRTRRVFLKSEDEALKQAIENSKYLSWKDIATKIPGKNSRQCRERWVNYLSPKIKDDQWDIDEDLKLINLIKLYGTKWSKILKFFQDRSYNNIKNRYYCHLKIKLENILNEDLNPKNNQQNNNNSRINLIFQNKEEEEIFEWKTEDIPVFEF